MGLSRPFGVTLLWREAKNNNKEIHGDGIGHTTSEPNTQERLGDLVLIGGQLLQ